METARTAEGDRSRKQALRYFAAIILALLSLTVLRDIFMAALASAAWTQTTGVVTDMEAIEQGRSRPPRPYNAYIYYTYEVNGESYSSGKVEVQRNSFYFSESQALNGAAKKYAVGSPVKIYYDPSYPSDSNLGLDGAPSLLWAVFFVGFFWIAISPDSKPKPDPKADRREA